jgi:hypothetical protein
MSCKKSGTQQTVRFADIYVADSIAQQMSALYDVTSPTVYRPLSLGPCLAPAFCVPEPFCLEIG